MKIANHIFNSELEFRKYFILNFNNISKVYVSEDELDHIIYFYGILNDNNLISATEANTKNFLIYQKIYEFLANELNFYATNNQTKTLKLIKKELLPC